MPWVELRPAAYKASALPSVLLLPTFCEHLFISSHDDTVKKTGLDMGPHRDPTSTPGTPCQGLFAGTRI